MTRSLSSPVDTTCSEGRLLMDRRQMLGMTAGLFSTAFMPNLARANTLSEARLLVVVLRGGLDGLSMLVPSFDPDYERVRRDLALPVEATLDLSGGFRLHPAMPNLHALYQAGQAAFVPSVGLPLQVRSHFECQENLENGLAGNDRGASGWINRLLSVMPRGEAIRDGRILALQSNPLIVRGSEPVLNWSSTWFTRAFDGLVTNLSDIYAARDRVMAENFALGREIDIRAGGQGAEEDPSLGSLVNGFLGAGRLLCSTGGPRVAVLSVDGWDTHAYQGALTGTLPTQLGALDQALQAFRGAMGAQWENTVVVCATEFGRTAVSNGTHGTDHGVGMPVLMVGGAVQGGIHGDWPGLSEAGLIDGHDLRPVMDIRSVFKGVLSTHLGVEPDLLAQTVFPDSGAIAPLEGLVVTPDAAAARAARRAVAAMQSPRAMSPFEQYRQRNGVLAG
ncbi:DUF1501 domain-containing protein [Cereibacter sphaeroides]|nr:DUF1501 domain-containing protein [Cereibacter sphaeroides]